MKPLSTIATALAGAALIGLPALAQQVGTATAVNPLSQSTQPGAQVVTLQVGAHIVHKERIKTTPTGTVQLLFLDKSTLSIGPNANLLIDEYVYNPSEGRGHMAISLTEGALRYVGGQLSHEGQATVTTPFATIGIRGGTATITPTRVINLFGTITIQNGGGTVVIRRLGFGSTFTSWNTAPGQPERASRSEHLHFLALLTSKFGQNGGVPGLTNALLTDFGIGGLQGYIDPNAPPVLTGDGESQAFQLIIQATQHGTGRGPRPRTFD